MENSIDACVCDMSTYHWPDVVFERKAKPNLSVNISKGYVKILESQKTLKKVLRNGVQDIKYLPRIYHGIISKEVLNEIYIKCGSYFPGPSPDMANAISACLHTKRYVYVRAPLIISGYSYKSAGGMGLRGAHKGSLSGVKQLPKNAENEWTPEIPKVWLGYTVWPESAVKSFEKSGVPELKNSINFIAMEAKIFLRYKEYRKMIVDRITSFKKMISFLYEIARFMVRWTLERTLLYFRKITKKQYVLHKPISLSEACEITDKFNEKILKHIL